MHRSDGTRCDVHVVDQTLHELRRRIGMSRRATAVLRVIGGDDSADAQVETIGGPAVVPAPPVRERASVWPVDSNWPDSQPEQ